MLLYAKNLKEHRNQVLLSFKAYFHELDIFHAIFLKTFIVLGHSSDVSVVVFQATSYILDLKTLTRAFNGALRKFALSWVKRFTNINDSSTPVWSPLFSNSSNQTQWPIQNPVAHLRWSFLHK